MTAPAPDTSAPTADATTAAKEQLETFECPGYDPHSLPHTADIKRRVKGRRPCRDCIKARSMAHYHQLPKSSYSVPAYECPGNIHCVPHMTTMCRRKGYRYCLECANAYRRALYQQKQASRATESHFYWAKRRGIKMRRAQHAAAVSYPHLQQRVSALEDQGPRAAAAPHQLHAWVQAVQQQWRAAAARAHRASDAAATKKYNRQRRHDPSVRIHAILGAAEERGIKVNMADVDAMAAKLKEPRTYCGHLGENGKLNSLDRFINWHGYSGVNAVA
ncbi:hypothetical protein BC828DRAFT_403669, partial [Blastocladiella britannica]